MAIALPPAAAVADLFGELLDRPVTARSAPLPRVEPKAWAVAEYQDSHGALRAVACCDLPLGASLAAAMTVMPPARVDDCIREKSYDALLAANLYESFNVLAAIFPKLGAERLVLTNVAHDGKLSERAAAVLTKPAAKAEFDVNVGGYKSGKFAIYAG